MNFVDTLVFSLLITRRKKREKRQARYWVHPMLTNRLKDDQFFKLHESLKITTHFSLPYT